MEDSGIDSGDPKPNIKNDDPKLFSPSDSSSGGSSNGSNASPLRADPNAGYTSKQLQRRLEARIESAKRLHKSTPALIPIQRLSIPGGKEQQPLVEWDTEDSEEDVVNFFPITRLKESRQHQELTDTFSIEEMSISGGEEEEEEEEDLHLVPPSPVYKRFGCCSSTSDKCALM